MKVKYALALLLLVSTCCNLTNDDPSSAESEVAATLRANVNKAINNLKNYGSGSASLSLIKFYLTNINKCLDDVLALRNSHGTNDSPSDMLVIANK